MVDATVVCTVFSFLITVLCTILFIRTRDSITDLSLFRSIRGYYITLMVTYLSLVVYYIFKYGIVDVSHPELILPDDLYPFSFFLTDFVYYEFQSALFSVILLIYLKMYLENFKHNPRFMEKTTYIVASSMFIVQTLCAVYKWIDVADIPILNASGSVCTPYSAFMNQINFLTTSVQACFMLVFMLHARKQIKVLHNLGMLNRSLRTTTKFAFASLIVYQLMNTAFLFLDSSETSAFGDALNNAVNLVGCALFGLLFLDPFSPKSSNPETLSIIDEAW
eukprot:gnl/Dysnectes_brevis/4702_a6444_623.p2 GENE.gnl/Dysnectes_brevis/4702_a6444_623~~gnl/Dysnectes_brevis/4702_a6444_623.p2  ORF type:complete len:289 (-),score=27.18 gnl/Dysnectes_brevis/4702_a6444_623:1367-2200(-)